ncbi:MAG: hypothetical protein WCV00_01760 [Verrucomicrobiia bacterium]|jgi:hypothetical protein
MSDTAQIEQEFIMWLATKGIRTLHVRLNNYQISGVLTTIRATQPLPQAPNQFWFDVSGSQDDWPEALVFLCGSTRHFFALKAQDLKHALNSLDVPRATRTGRYLFRLDIGSKLLIAREVETADFGKFYNTLDIFTQTSSGSS